MRQSQYHQEPNFPVAQSILDPEHGNLLIEDGWSAADLHVHSWYSYDVLPLKDVDPLELYKKAKSRGFRFITFTDHDTMDAYDRIGWQRPGIVPGVEIKILDHDRVGHTVHINVYQLNRKQFQELEDIAQKDRNVEELITCLKENNLPYVYNHPFWHEPGEMPSIQSIYDISGFFPVIEYNSGRVDRLNFQAMALARRNQAGLVASTDTHIGNIGDAYTLARGKTFTEYFRQIQSGAFYLVPKDMTISRLTHEVLTRIHFLFNRHLWAFEKPGFRIETGNRILDGLVNFLSCSDAESFLVTKTAIKKILRLLTRSGVPAALYIRTQRMLADRISRLVNSGFENQSGILRPTAIES